MGKAWQGCDDLCVFRIPASPAVFEVDCWSNSHLSLSTFLGILLLMQWASMTVAPWQHTYFVAAALCSCFCHQQHGATCTRLSSEQDHSKHLLLMLILSRMEILQHEKENLGVFWGCGGQLGETGEFWWPLGHDTEPWKTVVPQWGT